MSGIRSLFSKFVFLYVSIISGVQMSVPMDFESIIKSTEPYLW